MSDSKQCPQCGLTIPIESNSCICGFMFNTEPLPTIDKQKLLKWVELHKHHTGFSDGEGLIINYTDLIKLINSK